MYMTCIMCLSCMSLQGAPLRKAVATIIPAMKGKRIWMAFRVPTIDVPVYDLTCELEKETTCEELCAEMLSRSEGNMNKFLGYCDEPLRLH